MLSIVMRRFEGQHRREFAPGEIVDTTAWPKESKLHRQRYLEPAPEGATVPTEDADGDDETTGGSARVEHGAVGRPR